MTTTTNRSRKSTTTVAATVVTPSVQQQQQEEITSMTQTTTNPAVENLTNEFEVEGLQVDVPEYMQVKSVSIFEEAYPQANFFSFVRLMPSNLYYIGNLELIKSADIVGITTSTFNDPKAAPRDNEGKATLEARRERHVRAVKSACNIASARARKGDTIIIESLRAHESRIAEAALGAGGKVIVFCHTMVNHSKNDLRAFESHILHGNMLFISFIDREYKWNEGDANCTHDLVAALMKGLYVLNCDQFGGGVWELAVRARRYGKPVMAEATDSQINRTLISQHGCKAFTLAPTQE